MVLVYLTTPKRAGFPKTRTLETRSSRTTSTQSRRKTPCTPRRTTTSASRGRRGLPSRSKGARDSRASGIPSSSGRLPDAAIAYPLDHQSKPDHPNLSALPAPLVRAVDLQQLLQRAEVQRHGAQHQRHALQHSRRPEPPVHMKRSPLIFGRSAESFCLWPQVAVFDGARGGLWRGSIRCGESLAR